MEQENAYKLLIESLKLLALSYEEQKKNLPEFTDVPEDVVSSFENSFLLLPKLVEKGMFSNYSLASLLRVYNLMQWCIRNVDLNDFSNEEWDKVRNLSRETLKLIGEPIEKPDIDYV